MGKTCRYTRDQGKRNRNDERSDLMNPDTGAYDDVMDIYADQLDSGNENYDSNEDDEDDI